MAATLKIYLTDDSDIVFPKFDAAIDFCEKEFGFVGEHWDHVLLYRRLEELYEFLYDEGIDVEYFN